MQLQGKWMFFPCCTQFFSYLGVEKWILFAPQGVIKLTLRPVSNKYKFILRVWSLMPEQSEINNDTRKINVFLMLDTIFFYWSVKKWICSFRRGQKIALYDPLVGKIVNDLTREKKFNFRVCEVWCTSKASSTIARVK